MIAPAMDSAADSCDALNARLGFDHSGWVALAERVFAAELQLSVYSRDRFFRDPKVTRLQPEIAIDTFRRAVIPASNSR